MRLRIAQYGLVNQEARAEYLSSVANHAHGEGDQAIYASGIKSSPLLLASRLPDSEGLDSSAAPSAVSLFCAGPTLLASTSQQEQRTTSLHLHPTHRIYNIISAGLCTHLLIEACLLRPNTSHSNSDITQLVYLVFIIHAWP